MTKTSLVSIQFKYSTDLDIGQYLIYIQST